jgi:glucose/arabinose dehydrogenase
MKTPLNFAGFLLFAISAVAQPYGLSNRVANTSLQLPVALPTHAIGISNAFPGVTFFNPICIATPPGENNRLFILERAGRVTVITNLAVPNRTVFMDISSRVTTGGEEGLLGIAFHPNYAVNRYFYLFYSLTTNTTGILNRHQRVSRFQTSSNPNQGDVSSELPLITQHDDYSNHNGGDMHFGNDGYLYISLGDEGNQNDAGNNSQRIDKDFFSSILRIDVDKSPVNVHPKPHPSLMNATNYFIPADNPFVNATNFNGAPINTNALRAEIWATGMRNPWRMHFDRMTDTLYVADVGGSLKEEVNVVVKGGNYGWAYREGTNNGPKAAQAPPGFTSIAPILEYNHGSGPDQGNSITGGVLYRGNRLPAIDGKYVFADYVSGNIWSLTPNGTNIVPFQRLTNDANIVAFGIDPSNGDVLMADIVANQISRLISIQIGGANPPPTLAETGAFSDMTNLTVHPGIVEYDVNVPQWADNANIRRWFSIPATNSRIAFRTTNNWTYPNNTIWIQHFELETTNGVPESRQRVETRFLVGGGSGMYGITYRWNSPTNAVLVPAEGTNVTFVVNDAGTLREQAWRYPSQRDCMTCHNLTGGRALGFNTMQLNRDFNYNGIVDNQIRALDNANYFGPPRPTNMHLFISLAHPSDETYSREYRSRSYLHANCVQCHVLGQATNGLWDARIHRAVSVVNLINGPLNNTRGDANNRVVVPGDTAHSMLLRFLSTAGGGHTQSFSTTLVDTQAVSLVTQWIQNDLPSYRTFAQWQVTHFGSSNAPQAAATADPDSDGARNMLEYLTGTDPNSTTPDGWGISAERTAEGIDIVYQRVANRLFEIQWTTNLNTNAVWRPLNARENRPFAASSTGTWRVPDGTTNSPSRMYRARVYEP